MFVKKIILKLYTLRCIVDLKQLNNVRTKKTAYGIRYEVQKSRKRESLRLPVFLKSKNYMKLKNYENCEIKISFKRI